MLSVLGILSSFIFFINAQVVSTGTATAKTYCVSTSDVNDGDIGSLGYDGVNYFFIPGGAKAGVTTLTSIGGCKKGDICQFSYGN